MHVAHVIKSLDIGGLGGGAERFAISLSLTLAEMGIAQTMIVCLRTCSSAEQKYEALLADAHIPVVYLQDDASLKPLFGMRALIRHARMQEWDIVHTHYQVGALFACLLRQTSLLRTVHTQLEWGRGLIAGISRLFFSGIIFPVVFKAQVGVSMGITRMINRSPGVCLSGRKAIYIPNALSDDWLSPERLQAARTRMFRENGSYIVGSIGRLVQGKGLDDLITAFAQVVNTYPEAQLWLVGDGELRSSLEKQAVRLGIMEKVCFWGQSSNIDHLLDRIDLMVLPSLSEGLPTVLLESMASGTPIVASRITGIIEVIEDGVTGWLAQPGNPDNLAKKINIALQDAETRIRISAEAIKQVEKFSISQSAKSYIEIYRRII